MTASFGGAQQAGAQIQIGVDFCTKIETIRASLNYPVSKN